MTLYLVVQMSLNLQILVITMENYKDRKLNITVVYNGIT
jgi:hypothetical protein